MSLLISAPDGVRCMPTFPVGVDDRTDNENVVWFYLTLFAWKHICDQPGRVPGFSLLTVSERQGVRK